MEGHWADLHLSPQKSYTGRRSSFAMQDRSTRPPLLGMTVCRLGLRLCVVIMSVCLFSEG
eukprot:1614631-Amphidinium_carterae.1